ncbi:MAG: LamG domain-containing protein [Kiritimatiellae bacterium]|nr:LamG domain-containing protein [Kiritimatiellia bacterium]
MKRHIIAIASGFCFLFSAFLSPVRSGQSGTANTAALTSGLLFYQGFDAHGTAYLQGGLAHRFALDPSFAIEGKYGRGYGFEPPYANLLRPDQACPAAGAPGFTAGEGVNLRVDAKRRFGASAVMTAAGPTGTLWATTPVALTNVPSPNCGIKAFLGSVYVRVSTPGVKVRLEVTDEIETNDWRGPIQAANEAALKKDAKAKVTEPVATQSRSSEITLTGGWQRVVARLDVDARRPVQRLALRLALVEPSSAEVEAAALQLEQCHRYPHYRSHAGPWLPGGKTHDGNALGMPLDHIGLSGAAGTLACWVRLPAPEGGGTRGGTLMALGGGWWAPVWLLSTRNVCLGDAGRESYKAGRSTLAYPNAAQTIMADGAWHHLAATWEKDVCTLYLDGTQIVSAVYFATEPRENAPLTIGASTLEHDHSAAFVDEMAVWGRALSGAELGQLAKADHALATELPRVLLERPPRLVFHRGEERAEFPLAVMPLHGTDRPVKALLDIPDLRVSQLLKLRTDVTKRVAIRPWRATPGRYPFRLASDDGAFATRGEVEIVPAVPTTDFVLRGWESGPQVGASGGTAELIDVGGLESVLRRSMLADLRFDARESHPLEPARRAATLAAAHAVGRGAAVYPHVAMSLINTEVGIGAPPLAPWFMEWMQKETGLEAIPANVVPSPLLIPYIPTNVLPALIGEDEPAYRFAHWLVREGKGWPTLNGEIAEAMRAEGLRATRFYTDQPLTVTDAAGLDMLDYWEYPHVPSGLVAQWNRVCNIARLSGKPMMLTAGTIFWDPWPFSVSNKTAALSPDMLREYLWVTVAQPLDHMGIYDIAGRSLFKLPGFDEALRDTLSAVYPIGLLTGGLPAGPRPVAYLWTEGQWWQGPGDNAWIEFWFNRKATRALAEARLRFDWIGDDHVAAGWLKRYETAIVPGAWRIPERVHKALVAYAQDGGEVVLDKFCRAEVPHATILEMPNRGPQQASAEILQKWVRERLERHPDVLRVRAEDEAWVFDKVDGAARFIFVVNDRMRPGVLGIEHKFEHNLGASTGPVRDRGEAQTVRLTFPRPEGAVVYDVRQRHRLEVAGGEVDLNLPAGEAAVLAVVPEEIAAVEVDVPRSIRAGSESRMRISAVTRSGRPAGHRELVEISVLDAAGRKGDLPRFQRLVHGRAELPLRLPLTTPPGQLRIEVTECLSGCRTVLTVDVLP